MARGLQSIYGSDPTAQEPFKIGISSSDITCRFIVPLGYKDVLQKWKTQFQETATTKNIMPVKKKCIPKCTEHIVAKISHLVTPREESEANSLQA